MGWPAIVALAGSFVGLGAVWLLVAPHSPLHRWWCTRCGQPPAANSVAALRARENADQLPKYPTPARRQR